MSVTAPSLIEQLQILCEPAQILSLAVYHLFQVVFATIFRRWQLSAFLHPQKIRDEAFSNFWIDFTKPADPPATELVGSAALIPPLLAGAKGTVLEIGPGSGSQIQYFSPARNAVKVIYGAEPATGLHAQIISKATAAGLGDKYHVLPCSAETSSLIPALAKEGLLQKGLAEEGVFDTIVCVRVLCSVPHARETIENLYRLLRPGGKLIVVEHVVNPWRKKEGSGLARMFQAMYMLVGWRLFVGNCELDRDTGGLLRQIGKQDGGWAKVDLKLSFWWSALPYVSGELIKREHSWT